jgi:NAD(P)-dependent dehydrogenase (short-subunit alcohol dehydrogenase family)/3-oxoacyl-(acyl-carrier-protein) synthase
MSRLDGKLVLVTGAAKNVGKAIARELAARGAHILLNYFHSHDLAKAAKQELEGLGARVDLIRASVAQERQVDRMFDEIAEKYGSLDVLVNNAASGALVSLQDVTEEFLDKALDTNFKGSLWCSRRAAPLMAKRGGGAIVNVSALGGSQLVMANYVACGPAKAAVEALTRYLAAELAPLNVRVNTASAGMLESEVADAFPRAAEMQKVVVDSTPMGRLGRPEDLARLVAFLVSDDAAWVTGQVVLADGGLSLGAALLSPPKSQPARAAVPVADSEPPPQEPAAAADDRDDIDDGHNGDDGDDEIAIVGMGLVVPGANDPDQYWQLLSKGGNYFVDVPRSRWDNSAFLSADHAAEDKTYQNKSAFVTGFVPCAELQSNDAGVSDWEFTTLWLRHSLLQALRGVKRRPGDRCSFVVGYTADGSQHLEEAALLAGTAARASAALDEMKIPDEERCELEAEIKNALDRRFFRAVKTPSRFLPHRVAENAMADVLPAGTEVLTVDTACASSLYAIDIGIKGLRAGNHDVALCGGAFALGPRGSVLFAKLHGISTSGEVRAFDRTSDGVLFADGAGIVVLKKLRRALRDGDTVLAIVRAVGASSDGKGKAIYAPSSAGQKLAIERAFETPGAERERVDWVIAHATGTPAGDLAEFTTLRQAIDSDRPTYVTSNKSLIGHTGWAAGVVSVIQAILGLQRQEIPPQPRFVEPPASFEIGKTKLNIPVAPVKWPRKHDVPRAVSISGFGFGGTNAHVVVEEHLPQASFTSPLSGQPRSDRIALVGWSAHVPGLDSQERVTAWLAGRGPAPEATFGDFYPTPSFNRVRMPPGTVRTIDRSQLMVLECAHELKAQVGDFWERSRNRSGVFLGHMGPTRNAVLYGARCYVDDVSRVLGSCVSLAPEVLQRVAGEVRRLVPASNEDSFPGSMPNVIAARIANYFDLHGPNMTVDTGLSSALSAIEVASRYLRAGDVDLALVGGINGNTTAEMRQILKDAILPDSVRLAEGAFLFALVTEAEARRSGLAILAFLDDAAPPDVRSAPQVHRADGERSFNYLGGEGALGILQALQRPHDTTVAYGDGEQRRAVTVCPASDACEATREAQPAPPPPILPGQLSHDSEYEPGKAVAVKRFVPRLRKLPLVAERPSAPFLPDRTLVITDDPTLVDGLDAATGEVHVISAAPASAAIGMAGRVRHLPAVTAEAVAAIVKQIDRPIEHVRLLTSMADVGATRTESLIQLHDVAFLVLKNCRDSIVASKGSFVSLFLGAIRAGTMHPLAGLFSGLLKCASFEMAGAQTFGLFTDEQHPKAGAAQAVLEFPAARFLPIVCYEGGERKTIGLDQVEAAVLPDTSARLHSGSVVVAVGGARGITAEILKAIARLFRPVVYLLGSNPLDTYPKEIFEGTDEEFAARRQSYIREQRALDPGRNLGVIDRQFNRMSEARAARQNIVEMERHCGADRVHYLACDVRDEAQVRRAFEHIHQGGTEIDLLIFAAGLNRSAPIATKSFDEFRAIRDLKLRGYLNLKSVLRGRLPRTWCNFGSLLGFTGQIGEADYASGNDFLATSAQYASRVEGSDEYTIGWTLWGSVGLGAKPLTKAYFEKAGLYSNMATEEGVHHFLRELHQRPHEPSTVHVGGAERAAINRLIPGFFPSASELVAAPGGAFYLGRVLAESADEMAFERIFDLETDGYLQQHLVNGFATLPGTFVTEIAAEAAARLTGLEVIAFEQIEFQHFLRVYGPNTSSPKTIRARVVARSATQTVVEVRIAGDVNAPDGRLLVRDKVHFRLNVVLADQLPPAPRWQAWHAATDEAVPDPYHFPASPVLLSGIFASTTNTRLNAMGKRADYRLDIAPNHPVFSRFRVPCVLLDGLARAGALSAANGEYLPLIAPRGIRRIDLYERTNDCILAATAGIQLYATPREESLLHESGSNRLVAARPDGRMIVQIKDIAGVLVGYVHKVSGAYVAVSAVDPGQLRASGLAASAR